MTDERRGYSPTARARRLSAALHSLRRESGHTIGAVAAAMRWSRSKQSRIEHARGPANWRDVRDLCAFYGVPDQRATELLQLALDAEGQGWLGDFRDVFTGDYPSLEDEADEIRSHQVELIPGLLQTEDYAHAVIREVRPHTTAAEVDRRVAARIARQGILDRPGGPQLSIILSQAALFRCLGVPARVAAGQLRALSRAEDRGVSLRVLPFSAGLHAGIEGPFVLFTFDEGPPMAYVEGLMGDIYIKIPDGVRLYERAWQRICDVALSPSETVAMIKAASRGLV